MRETGLELAGIPCVKRRVPEMADIQTEAHRVDLHQGALAAGSRAQAECRQHLLPGSALTHRLPQHSIGPGPIASEVGGVEPEHSGAPPDCPSGPSIGGIKA